MGYKWDSIFLGESFPLGLSSISPCSNSLGIPGGIDKIDPFSGVDIHFWALDPERTEGLSWQKQKKAMVGMIVQTQPLDKLYRLYRSYQVIEVAALQL